MRLRRGNAASSRRTASFCVRPMSGLNQRFDALEIQIGFLNLLSRRRHAISDVGTWRAERISGRAK